MPDNDDRLLSELRAYYVQLAERPVPDLTERIRLSTDIHARRRRQIVAFGGALVAAAAVAAVIVIALVSHNSPTGVAPAHSATPAPTVAPTPTVAPATATPGPTQTVPVGPAAHGFLPTDVTAVSAAQWWVLGYDGPSCASPGCARILHTTDGGQSFASIPMPPVAPAQPGQGPADRLRFADPLNGWLVNNSGAVWATHDGGGHWAQQGAAGPVVDLEASDGAVFAITCAAGPTCTLERSPAGQDSWSLLPASSGHGQLAGLMVNGTHLWMVTGTGSTPYLLASADGGQSFTNQTVCQDTLGIAGVYAVNASVLWATCATGTQAAVFQSVDGGQHFTRLGAPGIANFASIAGVSSTTAVIGAQALLRTSDGGQTFANVEDNQTQWRIVGFTTSTNGFAFDTETSSRFALWRTDDAGAHWHQVQFP